MLLTLAAVLGLGELTIGSAKVSDVVGNPMLAFLIGAMFGISEPKLPARWRSVWAICSAAPPSRCAGAGWRRRASPQGDTRLLPRIPMIDAILHFSMLRHHCGDQIKVAKTPERSYKNHQLEISWCTLNPNVRKS